MLQKNAKKKRVTLRNSRHAMKTKHCQSQYLPQYNVMCDMTAARVDVWEAAKLERGRHRQEMSHL